MAHLEDDERPDYWQEPRITANANFLAGYIAGGLEPPYAAVSLDNPLEIRNMENGNRYRVTVEQVAGDE